MEEDRMPFRVIHRVSIWRHPSSHRRAVTVGICSAGPQRERLLRANAGFGLYYHTSICYLAAATKCQGSRLPNPTTVLLLYDVENDSFHPDNQTFFPTDLTSRSFGDRVK